MANINLGKKYLIFLINLYQTQVANQMACNVFSFSFEPTSLIRHIVT